MNSFIPWVGGKGKLLWIINKMAPERYSRFIDVFGGSGTVTMNRPTRKGCILIENYPDEFGPHKWSFDLDKWMAEEYHSGRPTYYSKAITEKREAELRELCGKRGQTDG